MGSVLALLVANRTVLYHAVLLHCVPCQGGSLCECSRDFVESVPQRTSVVTIWYALHPAPRCDTLQTNGVWYGFAFRCASRYGSVPFGTLWTTSGDLSFFRMAYLNDLIDVVRRLHTVHVALLGWTVRGRHHTPVSVWFDCLTTSHGISP